MTALAKHVAMIEGAAAVPAMLRAQMGLEAIGWAMPTATGQNYREMAKLKNAAFHAVSMLVQSLVDMLDEMAGDPDVENATGLEDAFEYHMAPLDNWENPARKTASYGAGCPISDPEGVTWHEGYSSLGELATASLAHEDAEDDDPDHGIEDVPHDQEGGY